jgi:hypothetical protein
MLEVHLVFRACLVLVPSWLRPSNPLGLLRASRLLGSSFHLLKDSSSGKIIEFFFALQYSLISVAVMSPSIKAMGTLYSLLAVDQSVFINTDGIFQILIHFSKNGNVLLLSLTERFYLD